MAVHHRAQPRHRRVAAAPARVGEVVTDELPEPPPAVDEADRAVEAWTVAEALGRLVPAHREVLVECFYGGRSVAEAAERLGVPPGTVKSRTHYALRSLRLVLEEMGVTSDQVRHAYDDGAYVLGALSPDERRAFERHLADCADCREAVAEIAVLPGCWAGSTRPAWSRPSPTPCAESRMPALLEAARARRHANDGRRRPYAGAVLAAASSPCWSASASCRLRAGAADRGTGNPPTPVEPRMVVDGAGRRRKVPVDAEIGLKACSGAPR